MKFVNREKELSALEKIYREKGFRFIPVYGRRRIGKTRLIQEFIKDKNAIYFLADSASESEQFKNIGKLAGEYFNDLILADSGFKDWYQFFSYLKAKGNNRRLVVVIDEFPYLVNSNKAISSIFQKGIDEYLSKTDIFLILMGSSVGMMEKEVLFYKAPLYGRRTGSLELHEMSFQALKAFYPDKSFDDLVKFYSVFGTVPAYIEKINLRENLFKDIKKLVLNKETFLYNEVEYILREELREPRNYFVILKAIAHGKRKLSEIINDTGFEKGLISKYIDTLRDLRFLEKEISVTEKYPEKSKLGLYRIHDNYFTFWFKYIFPNRSKIEIEKSDYVLKVIEKSFEQHVSFAYEYVCRDLCGTFMRDKLIYYTSIGRWWLKNEEIDIVALDEETNTIYFCECKWSGEKVGEDIYMELARKSKLVDWRIENRKEKFILFSRSGFTDRMIKLARDKEIILVHKDKIIS